MHDKTVLKFSSNRRFFEGTRGWLLISIIISGVVMGVLLWPLVGICTALPLLGIVFFLKPSYQIKKGLLIKYHGRQTGARIRLADIEKIEKTKRGLKVWYSPYDVFTVYSDEADKMQVALEAKKSNL